jgi:hypothetical protein
VAIPEANHITVLHSDAFNLAVATFLAVQRGRIEVDGAQQGKEAVAR